jgi:hypothetical protein
VARRLQIEEDRNFQERFWVAERVAWGGFTVILIAALAGLTGGGGPFAQATAQLAGGQVVYPRISRWVADDTVTVRFGPGEAPRRLFIPQEFLTVFELQTIQPEPIRSIGAQGGLLFLFDAEPGAEVSIGVRARQPGILRYAITIDGGGPLNLVTFVFP